MLSGAFGAAVFEATQVTHVAQPATHSTASTWEAPPFQVALAGDGLIGHGALMLPATSYSASTDAGGGLSIVASGWQLADPIAETIVYSNATPFSLSAAGGATVNITSTTNGLTLNPSNAAALGNGVIISPASLPTPSASTGLTGGVLKLVVPEPTNTSTPSPNIMEFAGGVNAGGPFVIALDMAASRDGVVLQSNGTCTNTRKAISFLNSGNTDWFINCNGNEQAAGSITSTNAGGGAIIASGNGGLVQETPTLAGPTNILTEADPVYAVSAGGTLSAIAGTWHEIVGACAFSASTTCTSSTQAGGAAWGVAFTGAGTVTCTASPSASSGTITVTAVTTTSVTLTAGSSNSSSVQYKCSGT